MAFRDKPQARCTRDTPPYGNTNASLAAIRRRVRSSNIGQTDANFFRSSASSFMLGHDIEPQATVANFIYFQSLRRRILVAGGSDEYAQLRQEQTYRFVTIQQVAGATLM
ncbi:MAG: hypothetical protein ACREV8_05670, partial [Gammaproteobacteria bacterium]